MSTGGAVHHRQQWKALIRHSSINTIVLKLQPQVNSKKLRRSFNKNCWAKMAAPLSFIGPLCRLDCCQSSPSWAALSPWTTAGFPSRRPPQSHWRGPRSGWRGGWSLRAPSLAGPPLGWWVLPSYGTTGPRSGPPTPAHTRAHAHALMFKSIN